MSKLQIILIAVLGLILVGLLAVWWRQPVNQETDITDGSCAELCQSSCREFEGGEAQQCLAECAELCAEPGAEN